MNSARIGLAMLVAAVAMNAAAASAPIVRTRIAPGAVTIGQPVTLSIDVLVPTWFGGPVDYPPSLAIPGAVAKLSDEHAVNLNERIDGESYAGMSKSYVIVPQKAGAFDVPAIAIRVPYAVDGKTVTIAVNTSPQHFEARLPPGAADLGYFIATRSYRLSQQVDPPLNGLKVGDAVKRTITQRATDLAPMFLPALSFEAIDGLELYPGLPVLTEQGGERGSARVSTRSDTVTYVLAKPGRYRLPGVRIGWFDPSRTTMQWAEVPEFALDVAPNPAFESIRKPVDSQSPQPQQKWHASPRWREFVAAGFALLIVGAAAWRYGPAARRGLREWRARRESSEVVAFRRLRSAIRGGDHAAVRRAASDWTTRASADPRVTLNQFSRAFGDAALVAELESLDRALYATQPEAALPTSPFRDLDRAIVDARRRWQRSRRGSTARHGELAPLNPPGGIELSAPRYGRAE